MQNFFFFTALTNCVHDCVYLLVLDLGSPPPKTKSPSARQTVCPQGATRRYGAAGQFSPPEDGAVRCAVHRNQSLRGLRQVRQRRFRLALL